MQVIRSLIALAAVTIAVAACAQRPVAYATYPATTGSIAYPQSGIDGVVYGASAPYAPAAAPAGYVAAPRPPAQYVAAPALAPMPSYPATSHAAVPPIAPHYAPVPVAAPPPPVILANTAPGGCAGVSPVDNYALDAGDRLRVVVFGQEGLTNSYIVDAAGAIAMPLIGLVMARGATTDELAARIATKLKDGFIREPHIAVEVEAYRPFFILGEVTAPGQYPYVARMTVETAVAIAGGFTPRAFRKNVIVSRNTNGCPLRISVPLTFPLHPGDTVSVQERWF
jgi:polysaccharide biosynthesis/export protein